MTNDGIQGFWSYTHRDNEVESDRIRRLAKALENEYELLTAEPLRLFVDAESIRWGEEWQRVIEETLSRTAFFIPVITPRYFRSEACRSELLAFSTYAESLGVSELVLPIYYADVRGLHEDEGDLTDELMRLVARTQHVDWRTLRLHDPGSTEFRMKIHELAGRIAEIAADVGDRMVSSAIEAIGEDEEPGVIDLLAEAEEAMPQWVEILTSFGPALERIGGIAEQGTLWISESDAQGRGMAGRLAVFGRFAQALETPASQIVELGERYAASLVHVSAGVLAAIRHAREETLTAEDRATVTEFFAQIDELVTQSAANVSSLRSFVETIESVERASRIVRPPLRKIRAGLRYVVDGHAILEDWQRQSDAFDFLT